MPEGLMLVDVVLAAALLTTALLALLTRDLFEGIFLFLIFGMLLAVVWTRLAAPDLALAEAIIGAGLTSALFLKAAHRVDLRPEPPLARWRRATGAVAVLLCVLGVVAAVRALPAEADGLRHVALESLRASGVGNPVTAVLLNYRGYDTLLEIAVLLAAALTIWHRVGPPPLTEAQHPHVRGLVRFLTPLLLLAAGYVLWVGSSAPGGAFQAGALLAGGAVLRLLLGEPLLVTGVWARGVAIVGVVVFVLMGLSSLLVGAPFLTFAPSQAGVVILSIEAASTVSIGYLLAVLYDGGRSRELGA
jgi:multisubunit Na+/H+ antiporter MnhB subunit